jgi:hypothetical protein
VLRWVEHDDDFKPAKLDLRFKQLTRKGITSYCGISTSTQSFLHLQESHKLIRQDFYRYLQIWHHFARNIKIDDEADLDLIKFLLMLMEAKSVRNWCQDYIPVYNIPRNILHFILELIGRTKQT